MTTSEPSDFPVTFAWWRNYPSVLFDESNRVALYFDPALRMTGDVRRVLVPESATGDFRELEPLDQVSCVGGITGGGLYLGRRGEWLKAVDPQTGEVVWERPQVYGDYSLDRTRTVVVIRNGQAIWLFTADTGRLIDTLPPQRSRIVELSTPADGVLCVFGEGGEVKLWDVRSDHTRNRLIAALPPHPSSVVGLSASSGGVLCVVGEAGEVRLWDVRTGKAVGHIDTWLPDVTDGCVSADGSAVALTTGTRVKIWDTNTHTGCTRRVVEKEESLWVTPGPSGNSFVVHEQRRVPNPEHTPGSWWLQWLRVGSVHLFGGPGFEVTAEFDRSLVSFSANGTTAVGYSLFRERWGCHDEDRSLKVWRLDGGTAGDPVVLDRDCPVRSVAVSADGRFVLSAEAESARGWDLQAE